MNQGRQFQPGWRPWFFLLLLLPLAAQNPAALAAKSERAKEALTSGDFTTAIKLYDELNKAVPGNPGLLLNLGMAYHMNHDDVHAIPVLESALRLQPKLPPANLFLGASYVHLKQWAKAIAPLQRYVAADPEHRESRQMLAEAAWAAQRLSEALPHFEKLAQWAPGDPKSWHHLGRAYEAAAAEALAQLDKWAPQSGYWFALAGDSRSRQQQARAAVLLYRQALAKMPALRGVHQSLAAIYREQGHADWAATEEERERKLGAPSCATQTLECLFRQGEFAAVLAHSKGRNTADALYWRIRALDQFARQAFAHLASLPPSVEGYRFLGEMHREQGRYADAVKAWTAALELEPQCLDCEAELAVALYLVKDLDGAQQRTERLLAQQPLSPEFNHLMGDIYLARQTPAEALPYLERAVTRAPRNLRARASFGRALLQANRAQEAVPQLEAALPLDQDGSLHFQLSRAYQVAGRAEKAKLTLAKYQQIRARLQATSQAVDEEAALPPP
jgi:predicted Zn-dependent protease